jgi:hypothetical protein
MAVRSRVKVGAAAIASPVLSSVQLTLYTLLSRKPSPGLEQRRDPVDFPTASQPLEPDPHRLCRDLEDLGHGPDRNLDQVVARRSRPDADAAIGQPLLVGDHLRPGHEQRCGEGIRLPLDPLFLLAGPTNN